MLDFQKINSMPKELGGKLDPLIHFSLNKHDPIDAFGLTHPITLNSLNTSYATLTDLLIHNDASNLIANRDEIDRMYEEVWKHYKETSFDNGKKSLKEQFWYFIKIILKICLYFLTSTLLAVFYLITIIVIIVFTVILYKKSVGAYNV